MKVKPANTKQTRGANKHTHTRNGLPDGYKDAEKLQKINTRQPDKRTRKNGDRKTRRADLHRHIHPLHCVCACVLACICVSVCTCACLSVVYSLMVCKWRVRLCGGGERATPHPPYPFPLPPHTTQGARLERKQKVTKRIKTHGDVTVSGPKF